MKILVVEDDQIVAQTLKLLLSSYNYAVDTAADGEEGLQMSEAFDYDLMVLDVLLPKLDGVSLCQRLRATGFRNPILLLTGQGEGRQKAIALNVGADDYMVKPFDPEELVARVQALLRRGGSTTEPILVWGDLCINPSIRKVTYGTHVVPATPKEYAILELFLRHPQKVFGSGAILEHVWNSLDIPSSEAVRVHIKEIRRKLKAAGAPKDLIKTVYQTGYRLNPLYSSVLAKQVEQQPTLPQVAELTAVNKELRNTLEELQLAEGKLRQRNEELEASRHIIKQEQRRYQDLFEFAPDGYLVTSPQGKIQETNRAAAALLEADSNYLRDKPLTVFVAASDRKIFQERLDNLNWGQDWEVTLQSCLGNSFPVLITVTNILDAQNQLTGLRWSLRDIRHHKQMEQQLRAARDELELRVAERTAELVQVNVHMQRQQVQWQSLFEHALDAMVIADDQGRFVEVNPAACQLFGVSREKLLCSNIASFADPELDVVQQWQQFLQQGQMSGEFCLYCADGVLRTAELTAIANFIPGRHLSILRDISERKRIETERQQAEIALQRSEAKFRYFAENSRAVLWIAPSTLQDNLYVNPAYEKIWGRSRQSLIAHPNSWLEAVHPDDRDRLRLSLELQRQGEPIEVEYRIMRPDGSIRWIQDRSFVMRDETEQIYSFAGIAQDITDRKQFELSLRASKAKLSNILASAVVAIVNFRVFDNRDWEYEYFSTGCEALFGYTVQELMEDKTLWLSQVVAEDRENVVMPLFEEFFAGRYVTAEYRFCCKNGSVRWITSTYAPQQLDAHSWLITAVNHDITDRKQAELMLQQQILRERLIADISQDIRRSLDLDDVLFRTVERIRDLLHTDRVIIFRFLPDWQGIVIAESVGAGWQPILSTTISDPCFRDQYIEPYRQGRVAALTDIHQAEAEPCYVEMLQSFQVKANLVVPILQSDRLREDRLWGLLVAQQCESPRQWQDEEIELLKQLANQLGIGIQQSELYQRTRQELLERRHMQEALQESGERFRSLSTSAPIGILQANADGICLYANECWQEISGLSLEASLGNGWMQAIHPEERQAVARAWNAYLQQGEELMQEVRLLTPQGNLRWIFFRTAPMRSSTGEIIGYVSTQEDITDRKQAEQKIREQAALLDIASDAIFVSDLDHHILYWNQGAERLYEWQAAEAIGQSVGKLLQSDVVQVSEGMKALLEQGKWQGEIRKVTKTGREVIVEVRWTLVRDEAGQPKFVLSVETDITEKKQLESQFYRAQRLESVGTLASGIAHDLNNVFTPILTLSHLLRLKLKNLDARSQELLELLGNSAERGADLVKQILTFARGAEGKQISLQIGHLLQEVANIAQQTFPKSITIRRNIPSRLLWLVSGDPTHLHQVLMNLCVNARDAMPDGGTLMLSAENQLIDVAAARRHLDAKVGNYVVITIADTGTGIPPELLDRIFDPFFTTKEPGEGTGLGLSTVLGIVRNHGGFLQVSSQVGKGTQFQIYLPAIVGAAIESAEEEIVLQGNGELVLIVDDEVTVQQANRALLESLNLRTLVANDGIEAIELYREHQEEIFAILIDIMMPNMDGFKAIRQLRRINSQVKIIAISGLPSNRQQALLCGANVFLSKPYSSQELLKTLRDLLVLAPVSPS